MGNKQFYKNDTSEEESQETKDRDSINRTHNAVKTNNKTQGIILYPIGNNIKRLCPKITESLQEIMKLYGDLSNTIIVGEEQEVLPFTKNILARLVIDYSSTKASFTEGLQEIIDNYAKDYPNQVGLIVLRNADESSKIQSEIDTQLPFKNTMINSRSCAFKLLIKDGRLNIEGTISKKNVSEIAKILSGGNSSEENTNYIIQSNNIISEGKITESNNRETSVKLLFLSENRRDEILRLLPNLHSLLEENFPRCIFTDMDEKNNSKISLIVEYSSTATSFYEELTNGIEKFRKLNHKLGLVVLRHGTNVTKELMVSLNHFSVDFATKILFHDNKFVINEKNMANVEDLRNFLRY